MKNWQENQLNVLKWHKACSPEKWADIIIDKTELMKEKK